MPTIAELFTEVGTKQIKIRGVDATLRIVPAASVRLLKEAFPRPLAPSVPDPNRGTGSGAFVRDNADETYTRKMEEWTAKMQAAEVALALNMDPGGPHGLGLAIKSADAMKAWVEAAVPQLAAVATPIELARLGDIVDSMSVGSIEEIAKKG